MELKQCIVIRDDLKLPAGKACSQAAHAAVEATLKSDKEMVKKWRSQGMKKIVLKVKDMKELLALNQRAKDEGLTTAVITDAGHTTVEPGTTTCLAIGPDDEEKVDLIVKDLKLF